MFDTAAPPSIDQIVESFALDGAMARHPATLRRFAAIAQRLAAYLATDGARVLVPHEQALLTAERHFAPDGAFTRMFGAEVLIAALPDFLADPWLPPRPYDARAQIRFTELLCDWVVARGLVDAGDLSCFVYSVSGAAREARARLRAG